MAANTSLLTPRASPIGAEAQALPALASIPAPVSSWLMQSALWHFHTAIGRAASLLVWKIGLLISCQVLDIFTPDQQFSIFQTSWHTDKV